MAISKIESDSITTSAITTDKISSDAPLGMRNLIINGDMRIAQRGTSASGLTSTGYQTVDRMEFQIGSLGTWTMTQDSDVPTGQGFGKSFKLACTTADASPATSDSLAVNYKMEGQDIQHLAYGTASAKSLTLSFWVKSNKTGTYINELVNTDVGKQISKSYTISSADTWEKKTMTFAGDTVSGFTNDNNLSMYLRFYFGAGTDLTSGTLNTSWATTVNANRAVGQVNLADSTSNYINITGVQLEVGDTATPFEHRMYGTELALCQRYCINYGYPFSTPVASRRLGSGSPFSSTSAYLSIGAPCKMRATPSVSGQMNLNSNGFSASISSFGSIHSDSGVITLETISSAIPTTQPVMLRFNTTTDYLRFDAEL